MTGEQEKAQLLQLYKSALRAHLENDARTFLAEYASQWYEVRNEGVRLRTKEAALPAIYQRRCIRLSRTSWARRLMEKVRINVDILCEPADGYRFVARLMICPGVVVRPKSATLFSRKVSHLGQCLNTHGVWFSGTEAYIPQFHTTLFRLLSIASSTSFAAL